MSILSDRYASPAMKEIWSAESKILAERNLWICVMKAQAKLGFHIPASAIAEYEKVKEKVDLSSIDEREKELRHDVKARIEEFNALAGQEYIHIGMTSRDLTENLELTQIRDSLELISSRAINVLVKLKSLCQNFCDSPIVARTHNVPAQLTTLGRRFASWAEELLYALDNFENTLERLPMRGIRGPVGISTDLKSLFGNNWILIEEGIQNELGFSKSLDAPVQIYPRSIDFEVVANLVQITSALSNVALNVRLMAGHGLVSESQAAKQVGSTVMPHKNNPRLSERLNGLFALLKGLLVSTMETSGNQWNEGDVSCSVVRRFVLPEAFFAADAIFITANSILSNLVVHEDRIAAEVDETIDILLSSQILAKSVESGMGREVAHSVIRQLSLEAFKSNGKFKLMELVKKSKQLSIDMTDLENLVESPENLTGEACNQTRKIITRIEQVVDKNQQRNKYSIPDVDI